MIPSSGAPLDYTSIGIQAGQRYSWVLSDVNDSLVEDAFGSPKVHIRNGKEHVVSIERITANIPGYEVDNWTIEYEYWTVQNEIDDDGFETYAHLYKDPSMVTTSLRWLSMVGDPVNMAFQALFTPLNAEAYLNESASYSGSLTSNVLTTNATNGPVYCVQIYNIDGILQSASLYYNDMLMYTLSGGIAAGISAGLIFIPILGVSVIGVIYMMMKNKRVRINTN